ncbi:MAG: hypothetical protein HY275_07810 [Gemmatimonadetes bacterium]|nr:hypothetical protein [Gemmatimonadota bacterium]
MPSSPRRFRSWSLLGVAGALALAACADRSPLAPQRVTAVSRHGADLTVGSIGNYTWLDANRNGIQDANELPATNVTLKLFAGASCSGTPLDTQLSDPVSGSYLFAPLAAGTYSVQVITPTGLALTTTNAAGSTPDNDSNPACSTVTIADGEVNDSIDFGFVTPAACADGVLGGVDMGGVVNANYLFVFTNGSTDANWQGATKGFVGNVGVDGIQARERTSGGVPFAGTIYTNDATLGAWQAIVNQNAGQAFASTGQTALVASLETKVNGVFAQVNALTATPGFTSRSAASLDGLNTQNGIAETIVINVTSGFQVSSKIDITGDAGDVYILRWDSDANPANGYNGQVKFQSGGAIVPHGGLTAGNFIHVAGDINASGGGSNPAAPYPQGPRFDNGTGALVAGGANFNGGGFFTGYWFTTGDPNKNFETSSLSNAIFVGGWYSTTTKFSMTSGTSGLYVAPNCPSSGGGPQT